jgi:hypothetical protein
MDSMDAMMVVMLSAGSGWVLSPDAARTCRAAARLTSTDFDWLPTPASAYEGYGL